MTWVDVTDVPASREGDAAVLFGDEPTAWDVADWAGTNAWDTLTRVGLRVPRVYVRGERVVLRARPPLHLASVLGSSRVHRLEVSLGIEVQVPTFRTRVCAGLAPSWCRPPSGQQAGHPPDSSQASVQGLVSMASIRFRHVDDGLLTLAFPAHT